MSLDCLVTYEPGPYRFYLYLLLYDWLISSRGVETRIFLDPQILKVLQLIQWRLNRKWLGELDDSLIRFFRRRSAVADSVMLYDASVNFEDNLQQFVTRQIPVVAILDENRLLEATYLPRRALTLLCKPGMVVARVGKGATLPPSIDVLKGRYLRREDFGAGIWLLHSQPSLLRKYLLQGNQKYGKLLLFHASRRHLERFARTLIEQGFDGPITPL